MSPIIEVPQLENPDLPLDPSFVEQAEYIVESALTDLNASHPDEDSIIRRLCGSGAKLLVGPRGCGKTTLMLKSYYSLLRDENAKTLPIYVNFKLSLKLEPLYQNTPNATYWFRIWLILKVIQGLTETVASGEYAIPESFPPKKLVSAAINSVESGRISSIKGVDTYTMDGLADIISDVLEENEIARCVLLLDDAAHAFSPRQQEDFFEFFRQIKSREISPKAAIYPGITTHSPTFHVGHDAEQIDAWVKPGSEGFLNFMRDLAVKRFSGQLPRTLTAIPQAIEFLAFASFGIPRSFLNMLRTIYHEEDKLPKNTSLDRRKVLDISKQSRDSAHNVYESLQYKLPAYREFVRSGKEVYQSLLANLKSFNAERAEDNQALEVGIRQPISPELEKVIGFYQYAGILMPVGDNSRGVKGVFEIFMVHFGDLINENAIIGRRAKSIPVFVTAFTSQTHQAWPRIASDRLIPREQRLGSFRLSLPNCQQCGAERISEEAKFCQNCGAQLKTSSLYHALTEQDISVLPISSTLVSRIKSHSNIRTVKDILIDSDRQNLRSIPMIGPIRAARIATYAEEHVT